MIQWLGVDYFAQPEALLLLLLIPLYIIWYRRYYRRQRLVVRLSYDPEKLQKPRFNLTWLRLMPRILQIAAICFLILALARPQKSQKITEQQDLGADVILLLDVSRSMENKDVAPTRFTTAKSAIRSLISSRDGERFGLVLFGPAALTAIPLTFDHEFVQTAIERTKSNILSGEGTALGPAIGLGLNRLRDSDASNKMMIIFSDGGANGGNLDPISAAKLCAESGVLIHTVAIASEETGKQQNFPLLQEVATRTGGTSILIAQRGDIDQLWSRLESNEPDRSQARIFTVAEDIYPFFLKIAIIIMGIAYLFMLTSVYNPLEQ